MDGASGAPGRGRAGTWTMAPEGLANGLPLSAFFRKGKRRLVI